MKLLRLIALGFVILALSTHAGSARVVVVLHRHAMFGAAVVNEAGKIVIIAIVPASAAAAAGFTKGDVLSAVDGVAVTSVPQFLGIIRGKTGGDIIAVTIVRDGTGQILHATLISAPDEHDPGVITSYESVAIDDSLRRTLVTAPAGTHGKLPAVLLIGGIGCFSVDAASNPNDAYMRVTHDITRAGFVTMRLEKSGVGDSGGPACHDVDFAHESHSYAVALDALGKDPRVDPNHVYLLGHSIGTIIAPRLALTQRVAGIIVAEAVGRNWFEYELINLRRQLTLGGDPPATVDATMQSKERCMHRLLIERVPEAQIERDEPACKMRNGIYPVADAYVEQVAALNVIEPWTQFTGPVLAIYGESDYVVDRQDHERIAAVVNATHPGNGTFRPIGALDHFLLVAPTPEIAVQDSTNGVAEKYNTAFSSAVIDWLCGRERCAPPH
jgi:alpha-beta hydrolase superfamily lysophospholipase